MAVDIGALQASIPAAGTVRQILLRPGHRVAPMTADHVTALQGRGLDGDRRAERVPSRAPSKRQVTLVMAEHLDAVAALLGQERVDPALVRRNLVVAGINLQACRDRDLQVGDAVLHVTGHCHPCSRMEEALGPGGYQAMRGHGGITATVTTTGTITTGAPVTLLPT